MSVAKKKIAVGSKMKCLNSAGWDTFEDDGVYTITKVWENGNGVHLDGYAVALSLFADDFELLAEEEAA